jgi:hypothetical protein
VKLADYGLFHMTGYGSFTNFPIGYVFLKELVSNRIFWVASA